MVLFTSNVVIRLQEYVIWPVYCHYYLMTVTVIWSPLYDVAGQSFYTHFLLVIATSLSVEFFKNSIHLHSWFYLWEKKTQQLWNIIGQKVSVWVTHCCALRDAVQCSVLCQLTAWRHVRSWGGCKRPGSLHAAAPETHGSPVRQSMSHTVVLVHHCITCLLNQVV